MHVHPPPLLRKTAKRSRHRPPHLVCVGVVVRGRCCAPLFGAGLLIAASLLQSPSPLPAQAKQKGRRSMAGRYDNNPFEEEDVNPFSVRAPILHPYGADLVSLSGICFLPRISGVFATSPLFGSGRGADLTTSRRWKNKCILPPCSIADAASDFFYSGLMMQWRLNLLCVSVVQVFIGAFSLHRNKRAARLAGSPTLAVARFTCL